LRETEVTPITENEVAKHIVDVAFKIHTRFGPGLLESVYETIMSYELKKRGLRVNPSTTNSGGL
jgi:GxxExxY protein